MKKLLLLFAITSTALSTIRAQVIDTECGTMLYLKSQLAANPGLAKTMQIKEDELQQWIKENGTQTALNKKGTITIPVVIHIIYSADSQNISDQRVYNQLAALNKNFSGQSAHSMGAFSDSLKANTGIQFCLASRNPDGGPTSGIERRSTTVGGFQGDAVKYYQSGGLDAWDPKRYFNIWVCNYNYSDGTSYIFSAYAQFPSAGLNETYGVVIRYGAFGLEDSTYYRGNGGILTHEVGHCFGLHHIWGDDGTNCSGSDYCDDTPNQSGRTVGKHTGVLTDSCTPTSPGIMYMNYMDYSDDQIYSNFTPDQKSRMLANFNATNGVLYALTQANSCLATGMINDEIKMPLELFPNPVADKLIVKSDQSMIERNFTIYNIIGNVMMKGELSSDHTQLNLNAFSPGLYFFKLDGYTGYYKIIKR